MRRSSRPCRKPADGINSRFLRQGDRCSCRGRADSLGSCRYWRTPRVTLAGTYTKNRQRPDRLGHIPARPTLPRTRRRPSVPSLTAPGRGLLDLARLQRQRPQIAASNTGSGARRGCTPRSSTHTRLLQDPGYPVGHRDGALDPRHGRGLAGRCRLP